MSCYSETGNCFEAYRTIPFKNSFFELFGNISENEPLLNEFGLHLFKNKWYLSAGMTKCYSEYSNRRILRNRMDLFVCC